MLDLVKVFTDAFLEVCLPNLGEPCVRKGTHELGDDTMRLGIYTTTFQIDCEREKGTSAPGVVCLSAPCVRLPKTRSYTT